MAPTASFNQRGKGSSPNVAESDFKKRFGSLKKLSYLTKRLVMMIEANGNKTDCVTL
jgi:hypothetical protein